MLERKGMKAMRGRPVTIQELVMAVGDTLNQMMRENLYEANLSRKTYELMETRKKKLRQALRVCAVGDAEAKAFVKTTISDILIEKYGISERNIEAYISFGKTMELSAWDKFQILLFTFAQQYGGDALGELLREGGLQERRVLRGEDIDALYELYRPPLTFLEKLAILTQRVFCLYRGLGIADDIREMNIDGVSGGVSGNDGDSKSLWIFYHGKSIHLAFLTFGSERELERVCNNIYRHNQPGQLSRNKGYIVNDMKDHSRVVVARPPFCESWVFFVRKFNKSDHQKLQNLYTQKNHELLERLLIALVRGCQNCAVTGAQGSGKTTLLMSLIDYIDASFNLRIQELAFELHLRDMYPERNIVTFRETDTISGQEGLDFQKKTDGTVNILGEVATAPVAGWMIQMGLTASLFTLFTHHAKTTNALVSAMANALLSENIYHDELAAKRQVAEVIRFDIHIGLNSSGERFVERITELVPQADALQPFSVRELLAFEDGAYRLKAPVSAQSAVEIVKWMDTEQKEVFLNEFA